MKRGLSERLKALVLALAVAAPMAYVTQISMGIWIPFGYTLLFSALSLVVIELIAWNRWSAIAVPAGAALFCLLLWWVFGKEQRQFFSDFFWWAMYFLYGGGEYPMGYAVSLTAVATFLVSLYTWLFGRKFYCFPLMMAYVVGFVLFKWLNGLDNVLLPGLLAVAGLIALWAKSFQRKATRKSKLKLDENGIALFLLPIAAVIVLLSFVFVPVETAAQWQNQKVYDFFERFNNYLADYTNFNRPRHSFSIARFGFMPMGNRLGGPTELSDEEVLHITARRPMLLRGIVYNEYTGQRWVDTTNSPDRRFGSASDILNNTFDLSRPVLGESEKNDFLPYITDETLLIDPVADGSSALFVPYRGLTGVKSGKFLAVLPRFNDKGEVFSSSDVRAGYDYTLTASYLNYETGSFGGLMDRLLGMGLTDTASQMETIRQSYLMLPDTIDPFVYDLTNRIISGETIIASARLSGESGQTIAASESDVNSVAYVITASETGKPENDYQKALAIKDFLKKNFKYTLSPSNPPEGSDFVSWFINDDPQGYCTYFATSMAVMARIAGIPARYCEGYRMPYSRENSDIYVVRGKNAHAWAELYFEGIGWIPFDATPSGDDMSGEPTGGNPGPEPFPTPTRPPTTADTGDTGETPVQKSLTWEDITPYLWILPVTAAAFLLFWVIWKMIWVRARISLSHVCRKYSDLRRRSAFYYFETLKLLEYYNYPIKPGETPVAYAARIDRWLRLEAGTFQQAAFLISRISYSDYAPADEDVLFLSRFCRDLTHYTYRTVGPWFYLVHRVLGFRLRATRPKDS